MLAFGADEDGNADSDQDGGRDQHFGDGEELVRFVVSGDDGEDDGEGGAEKSDDGERSVYWTTPRPDQGKLSPRKGRKKEQGLGISSRRFAEPDACQHPAFRPVVRIGE